MKLLARSLKKTPVFSDLTLEQVEHILQHCEIHTAQPGQKIIAPEEPYKHHLLILDGSIRTNNKWLFYGNEMQYCWQLQSDISHCKFAILSSAVRAVDATVTAPVRYLFINGDELDRNGIKHKRGDSHNIHDVDPAYLQKRASFA